MKIREVQDSMRRYMGGNPYLVLLMALSAVLVLVDPIVDILWNFEFLHDILNVIGHIGVIFYFAYIIGLIMCFAKDEMLFLTIAFGLRGIDRFVFLFKEYSVVNFNSIMYAIVYLGLAAAAFYRFYQTQNNR